jgi:hypothetical protein
MQAEARLQRRIVKALEARGYLARRIRPMGISGWPDIYVVRDGIAHHLEVKMPGEVPAIMEPFLAPGMRRDNLKPAPKKHEPLQVHYLKLLRAAGAAVGVVDSVEAALAALAAVVAEP